jgi:transposase-like protein
MEFLRGNSDVLEWLTVGMYARGLSTRDIEAAFAEATREPVLSRSAVSELSHSLWQDYEAFWERDLYPFEAEFLFIDAVYEGLRS